MPRSKSPIVSLEEAKARFEEWRNIRRGKARIPVELSGCLFVFRSRRGTAIKLLAYDGQGFWVATKRLSKGRFKWWPSGSEPARTLRAHQAQLLLAAANPDAEAPPVWRQVSA